jgi:uncharacterized membrane protein YdjX (TVP38/TMEM64 family)
MKSFNPGGFIKKHWLFLSTILLVILWMIYSYFNKGIIHSLILSDSTSAVNFISSFGIFSGAIFVLLVILEVVLAPIPPLILYVVSGVIFGGLTGGLLTLLGNVIGAFIDFKIARKYGQKYVEKQSNQRMKKKFDKFFEKYGTLSIFILRINPLTTSDLVSYLSGLTKIKLPKFLIATGLGLAPLIFIQTYLGDVLIKGNPLLVGITVLFSLLYIAVFIYLIALSYKKKKNN